MLERSLMHASSEGREDNSGIVCKGTQAALTINEKMRTFCFGSKLLKIYNNIPLYKNNPLGINKYFWVSTLAQWVKALVTEPESLT